VEEDHRNDTFTVANTIGLDLHGRKSNPDAEGTAHSEAGGEEVGTTTDLVDEETPEPGFEEVDQGDEAV
jgi:hypothetical protein